MRDYLRQVVFVAARGIFFVLRTYAAPSTDSRGQSVIGYELISPRGETIFAGEDFFGSPLHADDSDAALRALLGFLTLRPGDTDRDYFADYTEAQLVFALTYAEELSLWADRDGPAFVDLDLDGTDFIPVSPPIAE